MGISGTKFDFSNYAVSGSNGFGTTGSTNVKSIITKHFAKNRAELPDALKGMNFRKLHEYIENGYINITHPWNNFKTKRMETIG